MTNRTRASERGIALIAVLLLLMLVSAVVAGFASVIMNEQRLQSVERQRSDAFYAAHGGLEKLTSDVGGLFAQTYAPTASQVTALAADTPALPGITFPTTSEGIGYGVTFTPDVNGNPSSSSRSITSGPFQGFTGLVTPYTLSVTARTSAGGEARLQRQVHTVGIPIFQFGIFSEVDVAFEPGPTFTFTGRVHTNGNLFLGAASGPLTLTEKITAVGEVIREYLPNGSVNSYGDDNLVLISTAPGAYRSLRQPEGSVVGTIGSALNEPTWSNLSTGTYNSRIVNGRTGARRLDLPIATAAAGPIALIRRPESGETTSSSVFGERFFSKASLRILLSDNASEITSLAGVTGTPPVQLGATPPAGYTVDATHPPFALAPNNPHLKVPTGTPVVGGYLKVEKQVSEDVWQDVTVEILNLGIAGPNQQRTSCTSPNANAVIRLQHLMDHSTNCNTGSIDPTYYYPNTLFDTRQGKLRDVEPVTSVLVQLGGVIHYIELDVNNLSRWFRGQIGSTGSSALHVDGYTVYFSDRRGNRDAANQETGEYGFEDFVNPASTTGTPNGVLDDGEDVNSNGSLETYGATQGGGGLAWQSPLDGSARPWTPVIADVAKKNPARFFRRALKLTNGRAGNVVAPGLTVVSENPVYVQGDYNAGPSFSVAHVACAVIADAVTLLSNSWSDYTSYAYPYQSSRRVPTETWYRMAIMGGKGHDFPRPWTGSLLGSDGGVNNFVRFLEFWMSRTVHYRGSMVSLWYHRQSVYPFRPAYSSGANCNTYFPPNRDFQFDTDFLQFSLLPPGTPMFRDVNVLGFTQVLTAPR